MPKAGTPYRALALFLTFALPLTLAGTDVLAAAADSVASVEGRLVLPDGKTPWQGAVLQASPVDSETTFEAAPTDSGGRFALADLPAGDYVLSVRYDSDVYRMGPGVRLTPGKHDDVLISVAPAVADDDEDGDEDDEESWDAEEEDDGLTLLDNPLTMTLIVLGGLGATAFVVDELDDDDDENLDDIFASPSSP